MESEGFVEFERYFQMSLDPWLGCEEHAECEWAQVLNGCQVLFECGHWRYWYLGGQVLA